MKRSILFLGFLVLLAACHEKQEDGNKAVVAKDTVMPVNMPAKIALTDRAKQATDEWTSYKEFENEIENLSNASAADFYTAVTSLLKIEATIEKDTLPKPIDETSVKSRFLVIRTYLLEALSLEEFRVSNHQINAQKAKIITAYNSLKKDLNNVTSPKLIDEFLENEEQFIKRDSTVTVPNQSP